MLLRWLVNNWLQQTGRNQVRQLVGRALHEARREFSRGASGESRRTNDDATSDAQQRGADDSGDDPARSRDERPVDGDDASRAADASSPPPLPPPEVLFLFALDIEAGGLIDLLTDAARTRREHSVEYHGLLKGRSVVIGETGVGKSAAAAAAAELLDIHKPAWVVSCGFAGALVDAARRGHFVMAEAVADEEGEELQVGLRMSAEARASSPTLHCGRLLTVDRLVRDESERRALASRHDAVACDMETSAIANVCRERKTRFLSVRVISDAVDDALPPEIERMMGQKTLAAKLGAAAGVLWNRPSAIKDLWRLREQAVNASDRLAKFLVGVSSQLTVAAASPTPPEDQAGSQSAAASKTDGPR